MQQFRIVLGAALALAIAAPLAGAQARPDSEASPRVVVQGQASVTRAPDRAFVTLNTETRAPKPEEAQRANAEAMTGVRRAVTAAGIPSDAVRTLGFNLREDVAWNNGKRISQGYVVANSIEVRVDDLEGLGALLDRAVAAGANGAGALRYDLKDRAGAEREALRLAVADARARADAAATGAGLRVTRILRIEEQGGPSRPIPVPMMRMAAAAAPEPTPVSAGEIEIASSVTLTAEVGP